MASPVRVGLIGVLAASVTYRSDPPIPALRYASPRSRTEVVAPAHAMRTALAMSATKILWGQLLFVSMVVLVFLWAATEWTAWRLAFQPQLGPAWFTIERWPIYQPVAFFIWWFKFDAYASTIFIQGGCIAASGGIAAIAAALILSVWRAKEASLVTTYGSALWADAREVRRSGLLGADGVVLGRFGGHYLRH